MSSRPGFHLPAANREVLWPGAQGVPLHADFALAERPLGPLSDGR